MSSVESTALIAVVVVVVLLLLLATLLIAGALWRFLPLSQRWSELTFTVTAMLLLTPVPVGLGVGAMVYPIAVLYQDLGQLEWHFSNWYLKTPLLVIPSLVATVAMAYVIAHRIFPNRTNRGSGGSSEL